MFSLTAKSDQSWLLFDVISCFTPITIIIINPIKLLSKFPFACLPSYPPHNHYHHLQNATTPVSHCSIRLLTGNYLNIFFHCIVVIALSYLVLVENRLRTAVSALVSEESSTGSLSSPSIANGFKLTYLEVGFLDSVPFTCTFIFFLETFPYFSYV